MPPSFSAAAPMFADAAITPRRRYHAATPMLPITLADESAAAITPRRRLRQSHLSLVTPFAASHAAMVFDVFHHHAAQRFRGHYDITPFFAIRIAI
jgi:hypothetical protein